MARADVESWRALDTGATVIALRPVEAVATATWPTPRALPATFTDFDDRFIPSADQHRSEPRMGGGREAKRQRHV